MNKLLFGLLLPIVGILIVGISLINKLIASALFSIVMIASGVTILLYPEHIYNILKGGEYFKWIMNETGVRINMKFSGIIALVMGLFIAWMTAREIIKTKI
jgi:hypothetical protein